MSGIGICSHGVSMDKQCAQCVLRQEQFLRPFLRVPKDDADSLRAQVDALTKERDLLRAECDAASKTDDELRSVIAQQQSGKYGILYYCNAADARAKERDAARAECEKLREALQGLLDWAQSSVLTGACTYAALHGLTASEEQARKIDEIKERARTALASAKAGEP